MTILRCKTGLWYLLNEGKVQASWVSQECQLRGFFSLDLPYDVWVNLDTFKK